MLCRGRWNVADSKTPRSGASKATFGDLGDASNLGARLASIESRLSALEETIDRRVPSQVHIIGYARSGTTVLADILNSSPDALILSEFNYHILRRFPKAFDSEFKATDLYEQFNLRRRKEIPIPNKGAHLPVESLRGVPLAGMFDSLGVTYKIVGDKVALSFLEVEGLATTSLVEEFIAANEEATYIFPIRRPDETIQSVRKMFPDADPDMGCRWLAATWLIAIRAFARLNRAYIVFHQDIGPELVAELEEVLAIKCSIAPGLVGGAHVTTKVRTPASKSPMLEHRGFWLLMSCYNYLYTIMQADASRIKKTRTGVVVARLADVVSRLEDFVLTLEPRPGWLLPHLEGRQPSGSEFTMKHLSPDAAPPSAGRRRTWLWAKRK